MCVKNNWIKTIFFHLPVNEASHQHKILLGINGLYKVYVTGGPENLNKQKLMTQGTGLEKYSSWTWTQSRIKYSNKRVNNEIMCTPVNCCQFLTTFLIHLLTRLLESQVSISSLSERLIATCRDTGAGVIGNYSWQRSWISSESMT